MLDDKSLRAPDDDPDLVPSPAKPSLEPPARKVVTPATVIVFVVFLLLVVWVAAQFRSQPTAPPASDAELAELEAAIAASRADLNRQLIEMGRAPQGAATESIDEIATRVRQDVDTLVTLATQAQQWAAEGGAARVEAAADDPSRQALAAEVERLRQELEVVQSSAGDVGAARQQIAELQREREELMTKLIESRSQLAATPDAEDVADLERRLEEAQAAKEFFETRVKELEGTVEDEAE